MPASVDSFSIAQSVSPVESTSSMITTRASLESKSRCILILFSLDLSGVRISIVIDEIYDERLITDTVGGELLSLAGFKLFQAIMVWPSHTGCQP